MKVKNNFKMTINACFVGYIVQAIVNNFIPLLFLTFQSSYSIPLSKITLLITINFGLQLIVDLLSVTFVDKIGYRASMIIAHAFAGGGLISLTILPELFSDPFVGYIVQAIVNNFIPLLFLTFQSSYGIPLSKITLLITINFGLQLIVDLLSVTFVDKIGYRVSMIIAHAFAGGGLISLTILPELFSDPFVGLVIAVMIYAIGGGLLEVLVSPVMEACPTDNKEKAMSLLHSFYCWGHVGVVLLSTAFFWLLGTDSWKLLALFWAVVPLLNMFAFTKVPMASLNDEGESGLSVKQLFSKKIFWVMMLMMLCAGACEQSVSQWASTFAETGLNISKTLGDLAGPMTFAILMGLSRAYYGKFGDKINLERFMTFSILLCLASYICIVIAPYPAISLLGCAACGFSVGILWPGTFSMASASVKGGGTAMFALLALAGDLGCSGGPTLVGMVSGQFNDNLKMGILAAIVFPIILLWRVLANKRIKETVEQPKAA